MNELHLERLTAAAVLTGTRVAGLMVFCPFLGSNAIPMRLKAVLVLVITIVLYPVRGVMTVDFGSWQWAGVFVSEAVIGLMLGLAANFMMEAPMMAGQFLGVQMGYSLATLFDPQTQADTPVLGEFHRLAALLIFLQLDVHHWLIRAVVRSFAYLPPVAGFTNYRAVAGLLHAAGGIFLAAVQIAAPVLIAMIIIDVALGFLAKASPQLPVLFIGLAAKNLLGLALLLVLVAYWPHNFAQKFVDCIAIGERLLHLAH